MRKAYSDGRNEKTTVRKILDIPVEVVARDEVSGATIYGGDFGAVSSPKQKREMNEMMKKKEEDHSNGRQDNMGSVEGVREMLHDGEIQTHEQWRDEKKEKKKKITLKSVTALRKFVAACRNPFPKKPMTKKQSCCVRKYWLHGSVKVWRWRTQMVKENSMIRMKTSRSQGAVTIQDQKEACESMTGWSARKVRENLNGKASSAIEIDAILGLSNNCSC